MSGKRVQLFSVGREGFEPLPVPPRVAHAHELFDGLPLGVYSALRTFGHERFLRLERHFDRTDRSMELLGWKERLDRPALARAIDAAVRAYPEPEAFVRFDYLAEAPQTLGTRERTLLALSPLHPVPESFLTEGVRVGVAPLRRRDPLIKAARFVLDRRPYPLGRQEAFEHLILDEQGHILEGTSSNFLALERGCLHIGGEQALQGITQTVVAEIATELGLECVREPLRRDQLARVDEAFLTGSTRSIVPVIAVEDVTIGKGRPGPWTQRLRLAYLEFARRFARPAIG